MPHGTCSFVRSCAALLSFGFLAVGPLALIACGLTADYSGLQGGLRLGLSDGAPPPPNADATTDGALDAPSPVDGAGPLDAGSRDGDAAPDASLTSQGFCASLAVQVKLCDDFDEGQPIEAGWGAADLYGGEAIGLSSTAFSPPSSFSSAVNPGGAPSSARLLQTVPTQSPHVHAQFELLLTPSDGTFELGAIHQVTADGTTYGLYYREVKSLLQVQLRSLSSNGTLFDQTWPIGAPSSGWVKVDLDLVVDEDAGSFEVQQNGSVVVSETNEPTSTPSRTAMFFELGFYTFDPGSGTANFDDATLDWQ
jgi:hypothetical protein